MIGSCVPATTTARLVSARGDAGGLTMRTKVPERNLVPFAELHSADQISELGRC